MIHIKRFGSIHPVASLLLLLSLLFTVHAGQPLVWETSSRAEFLKGDARGVSISDTGVLMLAPKLTEIFDGGVLAAPPHPVSIAVSRYATPTHPNISLLNIRSCSCIFELTAGSSPAPAV